jgi:3-oxoacyl-[acyl-carrier-protein] synthase-1
LLERADSAISTPPGERLQLLGVGESSDAHHMSSPHPEGRSARVAIQQALDQAGLRPDQIDYINLHGTGTPSNDAAESQAVAAVFGAPTPPCSSSKAATGHTLGAAGAMEAIICLLALRHGIVPGGLNVHTLDPALPMAYQRTTQTARIKHALSNSFGFGGANCSVVFGRGVI